MMCENPVVLRNNTFNGRKGLTVPCGKCLPCKKTRAAAWAFRLYQEDRISSSSQFVTLTYDDQFLPVLTTEESCPCRQREDISAEIVPTLCKCDIQKFFKRLRTNTGKKLRYYACGEYGLDTKRPHYHAIMFNCSADDIYNAWHLLDKTTGKSSLLGHVEFGDEVGQAAFRYVTNYLAKSTGYDPAPALREFSLMSKGLGKNYLTDDVINWHLYNAANYAPLGNGNKGTLPRYYKDRIFVDPDARKVFADMAEKAYNDLQVKKIAQVGYDTWLHETTQSIEAQKLSLEYRAKMRNKL